MLVGVQSCLDFVLGHFIPYILQMQKDGQRSLRKYLRNLGAFDDATDTWTTYIWRTETILRKYITPSPSSFDETIRYKAVNYIHK